MADPFRDNPTSESWADMVEEDEALTYQDQVDQHDPDDNDILATTHKVIPETKETSQDVAKDTPQNLIKETPHESTKDIAKETPTGAQASRWATAGPSKSAMSSRWAALNVDRTEPPRASRYGRWQDPYKPTRGRLNRSAFEEDAEDHSGYDRRRGGFDNKDNFSKANRYREYYELNGNHGVPETEEAKKVIAAWNEYKPVDDTESKEQDPREEEYKEYKEAKVKLEKPEEENLQEKPKEEKKQDQISSDKKEEPLEQKVNKTLITSGFSWADDMPDQSDDSDNEEEDLLRLSGKSSVPANQQFFSRSQQTGEEEKGLLVAVDEKTDKESSPITDEIKDEEEPTRFVSDKVSDNEVKETEVTKKEPTKTADNQWETPKDDKESTPSIDTEKASKEVDQLAVTDENVDKKPMESVSAEEKLPNESNNVEEKSSHQWGALDDYKEPTPSAEAQNNKEDVTKTVNNSSVAKDSKEGTKEAVAEAAHESFASEEKPVYRWAALDDYKEPEPKKPKTKLPPKMSREEEDAKVAAWHALKVPADEEDNEEPSSSWNEESEKPVESTPSWNGNTEPTAAAAASQGSQSVPAEPNENKPVWGQLNDVQSPKKQVVKDTWKNKLQVVDSDNTSGWKSFASMNEVAPSKLKNSSVVSDQKPKSSRVVSHQELKRSPSVSYQEPKQEWQAPSEPENKAPTWDSAAEETKSWSTTINQIEITQPTPQQRKPHEVSFSLNDFQEEPKQGPQTISLSWKDFTMDNGSSEKPMSVASLDSGEHSTTRQPIRATIALYDKPTSVPLKLSDFDSNGNSAPSAPQISLRLDDLTQNTKPVESVHLKLSDFAQTSQGQLETNNDSGLSPSKHTVTNINQPIEERNPDKWGSVSDDYVSKQAQHFSTETSHPRRKIQMGGMQWANLQKNLIANKK